ncbi:MurR/RpiR family transcriptional regulator [Lacticigenium naphthae]|uniref:MurR/RpiR family transcriptional regulator n=1 Tax=Lacticigenium naphthae TaxID=515351 RepID=UPI0003FD7169|nr:SIS domain-containing protein [Lacticigenium naphthae]
MKLETLNHKYNFTEAEKEILLFMNKNIAAIQSRTVREVANDCYVSPATIMKLVKKLNLNSYRDLVIKISNDCTLEVPEKFKQSLDLDAAYNLILSKKSTFNKLLDSYKDHSILILATGYSELIGTYIYENLRLSGFPVLNHPHLELMENNRVLLIVVSESGETTIQKDIILQAQKNKLDIISFTGNPLSTISKNSTLDLSVDLYEGLSSNENSPKYFYGMTMILFESLFHDSSST